MGVQRVFGVQSVKIKTGFVLYVKFGVKCTNKNRKFSKCFAKKRQFKFAKKRTIFREKTPFFRENGHFWGLYLVDILKDWHFTITFLEFWEDKKIDILQSFCRVFGGSYFVYQFWCSIQRKFGIFWTIWVTKLRKLQKRLTFSNKNKYFERYKQIFILQ